MLVRARHPAIEIQQLLQRGKLLGLPGRALITLTTTLITTTELLPLQLLFSLLLLVLLAATICFCVEGHWP